MRRTQILTPALLQSGAAVPGMPAERTLPVLLEEVASVREAPADPETLTRMNGRESIGLIITKQSDANTISVVDGVQQRLRELSSDVLKGVDIVVSRDESLTVRDALEDVNATLILGAVLAMTVVFLFLHNLRGTVIVALALPLCLVATFLVMYVLGFTLNQMTLLALSLSVGILIDDSIVVLESITRHLGLGEPPDEAALNGRTEIGFADITTTLVDVVVFLPIAFMGGIVGGFFRQFGIVIVVSTLFSLLVSFTVTPTLSARWYRHGENPEAGTGIFAPLESLLQKLSGAYRRLLSGALRNRPWVLAFAVVTVVSTMLFSVPGLGFEFLPATDAGQISVTVELPPDASLAATDRTTRQVEKLLQSVPEVRSTATVVGEVLAGFGSFPRRGPQFAQISIRLRDRAGLLERITHFGAVPDGMRTRGDAEIAADIRRRLRSVVGAQIGVTPVRAVANAGLPIQLQLRGDDLELLNRTASAVQQKLASTAGVIEPDLSTRAGRPEAQLKIDRGTAAAMGVAPGIAAAALRDAVTGNTEVSLRRAGEDLPVRVRADRHDTATAEALERLPIAVAGGRAVEAREVGRLQPGTGVTGIERVNGRRMVQITANLAPGFALGNTQKQIERAIAGVVPAGVEVHFGGEAEQMEENIPYFALALGLAVALVYLVMAGLFNNLLNPLVILFTLPMALAGAMAGLAITGESLSLVSMIGIIMLTGLMGRNAILLLDYTATLRARGCDRTTALLEAGATRLRPILMTTFATIVGMLPVALRIGRASELRAPMAVVVIGGLLVSTVLTLVVIPVLYSVADDWATRLRRNIGTR
jgi:HAE1 family hydrophobic/amphiphilic exporter-1